MAHRARKRFGQHFLNDPHIIDSIVRAVSATDKDHVIEIGPGQGAITVPLALAAGQLTLIELDRDLASRLARRFSDAPNIDLISADALKVDFGALGEKLRIVGNLPYNISTPLLFHLAKFADKIDDMHFMLQKEVVDRITADPGSKAYGRLSVMLACHFDSQALFDVGPECFVPPPRVDSAVLRMRRAENPPQIADPKRFAAVVLKAFTQRRKTIRNSMRGLLSIEQIEACDIDPGARPEVLSPAEFARLSGACGSEG